MGGGACSDARLFHPLFLLADVCKDNTPQLVNPASMDPKCIAVSLTALGPNTLQCRR